jgi:protein-disulfide isomerase
LAESPGRGDPARQLWSTMYRRLTLALALALTGVACQKPVAMIGKQSITAKDFDKEISGDLLRLDREYRQSVYQAKKAKLDELIEKRVLDARMKELGVSDQRGLFEKVIVPTLKDPTDEEIQKLYDSVAQSGRQLPPLEQVKDQVAMAVKQQKAQEAMAAYVEKAKADANVKVFLQPYRLSVEATGPSRGPAKAPITIVEFSDFQCPYCIKAEDTVKQVMAAYPDKVRLVYRDFPLPMHPLAPKAAQAAQCAGDQGKYWELHGKLFAAGGKLEVPSLKQYARDVGLDGKAFDDCLDSNKKEKVVDEHHKYGETVGVSGTPAFFVNGRFLNGAVPLEEFKKIIDEELGPISKR